MSNSSRGKKTALDKVDPRLSSSEAKSDHRSSSLQFKTANIGQWAARQEDPFAKQNRERQARKQSSDAKRQKLSPYIIIFSSALIVAVAVWGLIALLSSLASQTKLPDDLALGGTGAQELQEKAQQIYNQQINQNPANSDPASTDTPQDSTDQNPSTTEIQNAITAVKDFFQSQEALANDDATRNDLVLIEIEMFYNNDQLEAAAEAAKKANPDTMDTAQKSRYYGMLANIASLRDDPALADQYIELLLSLDDNSEEDND